MPWARECIEGAAAPECGIMSQGRREAGLGVGLFDILDLLIAEIDKIHINHTVKVGFIDGDRLLPTSLPTKSWAMGRDH